MVCEGSVSTRRRRLPRVFGRLGYAPEQTNTVTHAYCRGDVKPAAGGCFQCAHYHELVKNLGTNLLCSRVRTHFGLGAGLGATSKSKNGCEGGLHLSVDFCAPRWI